MNAIPPPTGRPQGNYPFYPNHMFVESIVAVGVLIILMFAAYFWRVPLEEMANPADTTYVPRPEWYFLFYFQLLKYFEGSLIIVGVFFLPLLVFTAMFLLPFFDRSARIGVRQRPVAAVVAFGCVALFVGLTTLSVVEDSHNPKILKRILLPPATTEHVAAGNRIFHQFCVLCHSMDGKGGFMATDLTQIGGRASRTYIENVVMTPQIVSEKTIMSLIPLSDDERHEVSAYLSTKK